MRRRRNFPRRNRRNRSAPADRSERPAPHQPPPAPPGELYDVEGAVELMRDGSGFLRSSKTCYLATRNDPFIAQQILRKWHLRDGAWIIGKAAVTAGGRGNGKPRLQEIETINAMPPEKHLELPEFRQLTSLDPEERLILETTPEELSTRAVDLISPIGRGQRGLIVSPPKAGKTLLLKAISLAVTANYPDVKQMILLVDERPEEVTDMRRSVQGEVIASSADGSAAEHVKVAEMALEKAKRWAEYGEDVVILLDSLTRLGRAYNNETRGSGKILSGGIESTALQHPKRIFGAARNIEEGGSLTILGTVLVDTGSRMDDVIFEEFKGTGNMELILDRRLAERRIFPAIDITRSGTRKEEKLYEKEEMESIHLLRRAFSKMDPMSAMEKLIERLQKTPTNKDFLASIRQAAGRG
ncbi:MAG: transcription termination factor Rho [Acidobacteria bacterium]|nr:transcription termination factor Rho [Acidobacteriota bacterium]